MQIVIQHLVLCPMDDCEVEVDFTCESCNHYGSHDGHELECKFFEERKNME